MGSTTAGSRSSSFSSVNALFANHKVGTHCNLKVIEIIANFIKKNAATLLYVRVNHPHWENTDLLAMTLEDLHMADTGLSTRFVTSYKKKQEYIDAEKRRIQAEKDALENRNKKGSPGYKKRRHRRKSRAVPR